MHIHVLECIGGIPTFGSVCVCVHVGCVLMCVYNHTNTLIKHTSISLYVYVCTVFYISYMLYGPYIMNITNVSIIHLLVMYYVFG